MSEKLVCGLDTFSMIKKELTFQLSRLLIKMATFFRSTWQTSIPNILYKHGISSHLLKPDSALMLVSKIMNMPFTIPYSKTRITLVDVRQ